ncbi:MAG: amino acid adenylation domain-containing protein [Halioglobus sp.]
MGDNVYLRFAEHAANSPDAIAVIDDEGATTYLELAKRAEAVCAWLHGQQISNEQAVGVFMQRRVDMVAALLGIWRAGGAYIPLDPQEPPDRVARMVTGCGCRLILGDAELLDQLPAFLPDGTSSSSPPELVPIHSIPLDAQDGHASTVPCATGGENLAYLLFTSGSTGQPKAVEIEHRQISVLLDSARNLLDFTSQDRYLAASTIAFDASVTELFLPLVNGASLVLRDRRILLSPATLVRTIRELGITIFQTSPSAWSIILHNTSDFPRLRIAITHGEAVTLELARQISHLADISWNLYGPTETTVWATGQRLSPELLEATSPGAVPIGQPLEHVNAFVVDLSGRLVKPGTRGELCLGGPSVARGYRGNAALTGERFILLDDQRVYRTGDLVQCDDKGTFDYFGRIDDQMQIHGVRVEPGEVEAALLRDHRISQAAATNDLSTSGPGFGGVVAAVVFHPGMSCQTQEIRDNLKQWVPGSMIPSRFVFVPRLPTTTSGKIDRNAIRDIEVLDEAGSYSPSSSLSETEQVIADIWGRIVHVNTPGAHDNFFSIGGDSLSAVEMIVAIETHFDLNLPMLLAYDAPTIAQLAGQIDEELVGKTSEASGRATDEIDRDFLFTLAESGEETPIFFCHPNFDIQRPSAWKELPGPVHGIIYWAWGKGLIKARSIEELAASHISKIRKVQPTGPYRLAGFSLGGLIAFEIAQQLANAGHKIEMLFLLDPTAPSHWRVAGAQLPVDRNSRGSLRASARRRVKQIAAGPGVKGWSHWLSEAISLPYNLRHLSPLSWIHYKLVDRHFKHPSKLSKLFFPKNPMRGFSFSASRLIRLYDAKPYKGRAFLVSCSDNTFSRQTYQALLDPGVDEIALDVAHGQVFQDPSLQHWMAALNEAISSDTTS